MSLPVFSVIIPTYNRADLVLKTIASVLDQDFVDFEILVVDDGSQDHTGKLVSRITDSRLFYYTKMNGERGAARNFGTRLAKGEYINFFDSDDLMLPNHLRQARSFILSKQNPEFIHLAYDYKKEDGTIIREVNTFSDQSSTAILFDNILSCNGVFLRRDIALANPFEEDRRMASSEDWELWIRLLAKFPLHFCNEITTTIVGHHNRSIYTLPSAQVIARDNLMIARLSANPEIRAMYGYRFSEFVADRYTYFMLCLAEERRWTAVWSWALKALRTYPLVLTDRRFLASIRKTILR